MASLLVLVFVSNILKKTLLCCSRRVMELKRDERLRVMWERVWNECSRERRSRGSKQVLEVSAWVERHELM